MIMGKDDLTLFVTSPGGVIISLKSPLQTPIESTDFHIHCADITQVPLDTLRINQDMNLIKKNCLPYKRSVPSSLGRTLLQRKLSNLGRKGRQFVHLEAVLSRGESHEDEQRSAVHQRSIDR